MEKFDIVSRPSHYAEGRKYEPKDVIRDWNLNFNLGSAVKYISRAGRKDDILQDLKKAQTFLSFEIEALENERKENDVQEKWNGYWPFSSLEDASNCLEDMKKIIEKKGYVSLADFYDLLGYTGYREGIPSSTSYGWAAIPSDSVIKETDDGWTLYLPEPYVIGAYFKK